MSFGRFHSMGLVLGKKVTLSKLLYLLNINYCPTVEEKIISTREASFLLGMFRQRLLVLLAQGRVKGSQKNGRF
ncbi:MULTISPECIES: hypothetical protein [unclassified Okeania]|nr:MULTISPECIES: hypothetical protein [unclassified Okeania]NET13978.1 hypothetical protein [Okeania sp. SIO1H6]NET23205.1 hypothetical protein [Okeania sp. SIO1H5]NET79936.1 hypothetical protein [Okeania sp. SIO1F9]NET96968.1 hypothetical protein [Okeania sp. SIO1H2]